jgi:lysosomal alpha-mannosidase
MTSFFHSQNSSQNAVFFRVMSDESTTYYTDIIDQQWLGLNFILREFGECARPRAAWQIDPFGHSREQASLFAQFGFDSLFLGRVDYQDIQNRKKTQKMEMMWEGSSSLGDSGRIFTTILPNLYEPPPGFCFDRYCADDPIMDDPDLDGYNVVYKVQKFLEYTHQQAKWYKTKNLIMTMGSDFQASEVFLSIFNSIKLFQILSILFIKII